MPEQKEIVFDTKYISRPLEINGVVVPEADFNLDFNEDFYINESDVEPSKIRTLGITIQPLSTTPNIVEAQLNNTPKQYNVNNKTVDPGELSIIIRNGLQNIDLYIEENGDLIITGDESSNYFIDELGYLNYIKR